MLSNSEEEKIEAIANTLYRRVEEETKVLLLSQLLKALGVKEIDNKEVKRTLYPDDPRILATYEFNGRKILGVRVGDNDMGIVFDVPNLETQKEVQNV